MEQSDQQLEALLRLNVECERAGVFRASPRPCHVGVPALGSGGGGGRWSFGTFLNRAGLPLAAALGLVVGLELLNSPKIPTASNGVGGRPAVAMSNCNGAESIQYTVASFNSCITGPGEPIDSGECICADLDRDGDVDLLDFGILQRSPSLVQ